MEKKGQMGTSGYYRNSEYYRGMDSLTADMVWNLKSQLTQLQHENQMLKLKLQQIENVLKV